MTDDELRSICHNVWTVQLGLRLEDETERVQSPAGRGWLSATVHLEGRDSRSVCLEAPVALGRVVAASMFTLAEEMLSDDDVTDVLGEIVNIVGGNLKALVEGVVRTSMPEVEWLGREQRTKGVSILNRVRFRCQGHPVRVSILQSESGGSTRR